jgi:dCTP deaminase
VTVLSDKEIKQLIRRKRIVIHPILAEKQIQGAKIDLRLGNIIYLIKYFEHACYDPKVKENIEYGEEKQISFDIPFILQPGDFAIAPLFERVRLPDDIIGRLDGRSSFGRLGIIIHATAGGIDPGYCGKITCELSNLGKVPVALYPLTRIASLTLERLQVAAEKPYNIRSDKKYKSVLSTLLSDDYEYKENLFEKLKCHL